MKNNKAFTVWSRNVKKFRKNTILELRRSLSIPDEGFETADERDVWEDEAKKEFAEFGEITDFTEKAKNYGKWGYVRYFVNYCGLIFYKPQHTFPSFIVLIPISPFLFPIPVSHFPIPVSPNRLLGVSTLK